MDDYQQFKFHSSIYLTSFSAIFYCLVITLIVFLPSALWAKIVISVAVVMHYVDFNRRYIRYHLHSAIVSLSVKNKQFYAENQSGQRYRIKDLNVLLLHPFCIVLSCRNTVGVKSNMLICRGTISDERHRLLRIALKQYDENYDFLGT